MERRVSGCFFRARAWRADADPNVAQQLNLFCFEIGRFYDVPCEPNLVKMQNTINWHIGRLSRLEGGVAMGQSKMQN